MAKTKEISRRIKSITSTKKITRAMEMVSAAKMRKAIEAVLKTRAYADLSWETVLNLVQLSVKRQKPLHYLLKPCLRAEKVAIILITSNRGMCSSYNTAVITKAKESIARHQVATDFILAGRKGAVVYNQNYQVAAEFPKNELLTEASDIYPIAKMVLDDYSSGKYDKIFVAYTDYINPVKQVPRVKQLLPVELESKDNHLGVTGQDPRIGLTKDKAMVAVEKGLTNNGYSFEFIFEPSPEKVLDRMIPRLVEIQLYQAFLEANASEHSARMTAMHQATEAAADMVAELTLFYNKARQANITSEIAEISAGANAQSE